MKRSRLLPVLLSLALVATLPSAYARPFGKSDKSPHAAAAAFSASKAISSSPASKAGNGSLSIQEVETKLLRFATSLQKPRDMDYKQLEEMLSIRFDPPKDLTVSRRVLKSSSLAHGYTLYVSHSHETKGFSFINLLIGLPDKADPTRTSAAACIWDAAAFSQKLEAIGYKRGGQRPFQGGAMRQHWRSIQNGAQGFSFALLIYETNTNGVTRECVYGAQIVGSDA